MPKADGSVLINTKVDTSGMQAGIKEIEGGITRLGSGLKKIAGIIGAAFAVKQIIAFSRECIELGSDLEEVQNVVDVTFGKMSGVIETFSKEAATQFGISELAAKQYTSTIGAMYKSMGFTEDAAANMSIEMTKLAADMASFYNLDADVAFQKIRSGIAGETEPLKQLGINLSEVNLEEFRLAQGLDTAYSKMNQQEKALLRYNYLLSVTSDAQGDFARTSGSWANQVKVLRLQFQSIKADLGAGFINVFLPVLQVINKLLQGLAKLASAFKAFTELITGKKSSGATSTSGGIDTSDITAATDAYYDASEATQNYADATDNSAKATKAAAKENKRYLSGLDEIRRFETDNTATGGSGSGGSGKTGKVNVPGSGGALAPVDYGKLAGGETVVDKLAQKMKKLFDAIRNGVQPTVAALKRLWSEGLQQLGKFTWQALKDFYKDFLVPVGKWTFGEGLPRFIDAINNGLMAVNWERLNGALAELWAALAPFAINVGEGLLWLWENVLVPLGVWTYNEVVPRFLQTLANLISIADAIIEAARPGFDWFFNNVLLPIASWTGGVFTAVWDRINGALAVFAQWCKDNPAVIENVTTFVSAFFTALAGIAVVTKIWTMITSIGGFIGMISKLVGAIGTILTSLNPVTIAIAAAVAVGVLLWKNWDTIKAKAIEVWEYLKVYLPQKWEEIKGYAVEKFNMIVTTIQTAWANIKSGVQKKWAEIKKDLAARWNAIKGGAVEKFEEIRDKIASDWTAVKTKAQEIWVKIKTDLGARWDAIKGWAVEKFTAIKNTIGGAWDAVKTGVAEKWAAIKKNLGDRWDAIKGGATEKFTAIKTTIGDTWNAISEKAGEIWETISTTVTGFFDTISSYASEVITPIATVFSDAWEAIQTSSGDIVDWVNDTFSGLWESAWNGIADLFSTAFSGIGNVIAVPLNIAIGAINGMIEVLNGLIEKINSISFRIDIPKWVPKIGGSWWGFDGFNMAYIGYLDYIPELAKGAVIPPNAPFLAKLGDQKNGTNIEAPLETIKQAVRDVTGGEQPIHITINLDGRAVYDGVIRQGRKQQQASGINPFELA